MILSMTSKTAVAMVQSNRYLGINNPTVSNPSCNGFSILNISAKPSGPIKFIYRSMSNSEYAQAFNIFKHI